ncbi:MAG: ferrous iron transport protein B [Chitinivibrionia bacterium]|nr:ferrous iron transport protein B [Chitinivibrionia bacterium]
MLKVVLAGNPNSGKTTIFNALTGLHQRVGNYSGVTVEVKSGFAKFGEEKIEIIDLPGAYSLSAYSPEEKVARDFILNEKPDAVIDVVDSSNIERNLYLTSQFLELGIHPIIALNMWDEAKNHGMEIDTQQLSKLLQSPVVKTIGRIGDGIEELLETAVKHSKNTYSTPIFPVLAPELQKDINLMTQKIQKTDFGKNNWFPAQYSALKLLENDKDIISIAQAEKSIDLVKMAKDVEERTNNWCKDAPDYLISEARYGFAVGIVREVVKVNALNKRVDYSDKIDAVLTHKFWAYPIFALFLWLIFQMTFVLGEYPTAFISFLFEKLYDLAAYFIPDGWFRSLITDGMISGVGAVTEFLPNILILFMGISIMEDTGYMARAAFIVDKFMHKIGLHGKSFISVIIGMGCSIPAVMATKALESPTDRIKTILLTPLISCSARLPVFILFAGAFFPKNAANVVFLFQFVLGFFAFALMALLFKKTVFYKADETPFVMELPPYRMPTLRSVLIHMWQKGQSFLIRIGTVVLVFSMVLWYMGKYPLDNDEIIRYEAEKAKIETSVVFGEEKEEKLHILENQHNSIMQKSSYIGRIGKFLEPVVKPFGSDWGGAVALVTGFIGKEIVVSSMSVLYAVDEGDDDSFNSALKKHFTPLSAIAFMWFVLVYTPCMAAFATVVRELNSWKWSLFSLFYQLAFAWCGAVAIFQVGKLLGFE